uniref:Uncharacterized protein n=1 Tax=Candidatus Kentrum sp. TC TaxID=2126339 RepID=A0A450YM90_9GAMM|nr:MAG: hypothetical protein BECKTC1821E_GA0114239_102027 [Candidatus Kentron sp. TC]
MVDETIVSKETIRRLAADLATHLPVDPDSLDISSKQQRGEHQRAGPVKSRALSFPT